MFLHNVNAKRLGLLIVSMFAFVFLTDGLIHGFLMADAYKQTAHLWRAEVDMQAYFPMMLLGQFLIGAFFSLIFVKGYEGKGIAEGIRYGLLVAALLTGPILIQFATTPIPSHIILSWMAANLAQCLLGGVLVSLIYKR